MKTIQAILNLSNAGISAIREKAELIILKMLNNPFFPTPTPSLDTIKIELDALAQDQAEQAAAYQTYKEKTKVIAARKINIKSLLRQEGTYVEIIAEGDESIILSSGFDVKHNATPTNILNAPLSLLAVEGNGAGELVCTWQSVKGAKAYNVEQSLDISNPNNWQHVQTVTKIRCVVKGLSSGARMWFRVAAVGAVGEGAFSDVTTRIVP